MEVITDTSFLGIPMFSRGKVRDIYEVDGQLLIISTDRISAFDVIMEEGIPGKGEVLNRLAAYWLDLTKDIVPNHVITTDMNRLPGELARFTRRLQGRSMLVKKAKPLPVECVVRGYLAGSGWKDYRETGTLCGIQLPPGLLQADRLPEPLFTPSTKAEIGTHDENIAMDAVVAEVGRDVADLLERYSLALYDRGVEVAREKGLILADTKFEFGYVGDDVILIDEAMTPDSSRFWPMSSYEPGHDQENLDKQYLRDWLETLDWDKKAPPPHLTPEVIERTAELYEYIKGVFLD
jgi:phosphoribosylaminoimidazole-succinocarboxamide synthase